MQGSSFGFTKGGGTRSSDYSPYTLSLLQIKDLDPRLTFFGDPPGLGFHFIDFVLSWV